ncbi:protein of unknown function [Candidatus Filomicrobium marinum]|uniref:Uncharacterized protein n=1 Tax=Candidatus Filomicrobium marinum TaxID=1608628 RepID=A0A0D6JLQ7_9HYPH|nr:protein of unknown function [Candidatus Filomicrobium marinum]CPR22595.1 protein of unknown function [Candidatus Filomicrobium marinum]
MTIRRVAIWQAWSLCSLAFVAKPVNGFFTAGAGSLVGILRVPGFCAAWRQLDWQLPEIL